jgi:hypothetical protein
VRKLTPTSVGKQGYATPHKIDDHFLKAYSTNHLEAKETTIMSVAVGN